MAIQLLRDCRTCGATADLLTHHHICPCQNLVLDDASVAVVAVDADGGLPLTVPCDGVSGFETLNRVGLWATSPCPDSPYCLDHAQQMADRLNISAGRLGSERLEAIRERVVDGMAWWRNPVLTRALKIGDAKPDPDGDRVAEPVGV